MGIIPERLQHSRAYQIFQKVLRVLQFLSAIISLGFFSRRLYQIVKVLYRANRSYGAVEGLLVAGVLYTLIMMILKLSLKGGAPNILRWIMIVLDIAFVGAFIAVAVLTRPNGGPSGPCPTYRGQAIVPDSTPVNCNLPWGTFILAIVSTFLHALTALFHEARNYRKRTKAEHQMAREEEKVNQQRHQHQHQSRRSHY